jgi:hypothetical protein
MGRAQRHHEGAFRVRDGDRRVTAVAVPAVLQRRDLPETIRSLTTLTRIDYFDLFTVSAPAASDRPAEEWSRAALEGASPTGRFIAWQVLCGLRLDTRPAPDHVAGWKLADRGENWIRIEAASWFMTAHVVVAVEDDEVSVALLIRYDRQAGGFIWRPLSVMHRRLMPGLLRHAVRRMDRRR